MAGRHVLLAWLDAQRGLPQAAGGSLLWLWQWCVYLCPVPVCPVECELGWSSSSAPVLSVKHKRLPSGLARLPVRSQRITPGSGDLEMITRTPDRAARDQLQPGSWGGARKGWECVTGPDSIHGGQEGSFGLEEVGSGAT